MLTTDVLKTWCKEQANRSKLRGQSQERVPMYAKKLMVSIKMAAFAESLEAAWVWYKQPASGLRKEQIMHAAAELALSICEVRNQSKISYDDSLLLIRRGYGKEITKLRKNVKPLERILYDMQREESPNVVLGSMMAVLESLGFGLNDLNQQIIGKGRAGHVEAVAN